MGSWVCSLLHWMFFLILESHLADGGGIENILEDEVGWDKKLM
jgi:hypothetical protein